jgi:protein CpxP
MKDEQDAARAKTQSDVRALLTPEQQKTFDQIQKDEAQRRADRTEFEAWKAQKAQKTQ